jgi:hypothetical protein
MAGITSRHICLWGQAFPASPIERDTDNKHKPGISSRKREFGLRQIKKSIGVIPVLLPK